MDHDGRIKLVTLTALYCSREFQFLLVAYQEWGGLTAGAHNRWVCLDRADPDAEGAEAGFRRHLRELSKLKSDLAAQARIDLDVDHRPS